MRRLLLAGCLTLAVASAASTQITQPKLSAPADDALSPMELLAGKAPPAGAETEAAAKAGTGKGDPAKAGTPAKVADPAKAGAAKSEAAKKKADTAKPDAPKAEIDHLAQCLRDWDRGTHMSRQEWSRTCRRVVSARNKASNQPAK